MSETVNDNKWSFARWWTAVSTDKRPKPNPARMVTVEELPIYPDGTPHYREVREPPLPMQEEVALLRRAAVQRFGTLEESYHSVEEKSKKAFNLSQEFSQRLQEDYGMLPKAAAITVGGLAGFLLGMKKSVLRRFLYSGAGLLTMTAFCYPYETIAVIHTAVEHSKMAWNDFARSPEPPVYPPPRVTESSTTDPEQ